MGDRAIGRAAKQRAIVVESNHLPFTLARAAKGFERSESTGGLVAALQPILRKPTAALHRLPDADAVRRLLDGLGRRSKGKPAHRGRSQARG